MLYRKPPTKAQIYRAKAAAANAAYEAQYAQVLTHMVRMRGVVPTDKLRPLTAVFAEAKVVTDHLKARCPSLFKGDNCGYLSVNAAYAGASE